MEVKSIQELLARGVGSRCCGRERGAASDNGFNSKQRERKHGKAGKAYQECLQMAPVQLPKSQERFFSNALPTLGGCLIPSSSFFPKIHFIVFPCSCLAARGITALPI